MRNRFATLFAVAFVAVCLLSALPAVAQVASAEYRDPNPQRNDYIGPFVSEIWMRLYRPSRVSTAYRYPLIVMLHGNHPTCGKNNTTPRVDDDWQYSTNGSCPSGYSVVKSHEGYAYLAEDLARRGYFVVSINANRGFNDSSNPNDAGQLWARGRLVLWHLSLLSAWNQGTLTTPASLGIDLRNRIDFNHVGLMGHSRGAVGMRAAVALYRDESLWRYMVPDPVTFRALLEIAPPRQPDDEPQIPNARDVAFLNMVGMCDTDVVEFEGGKHFDRILRSAADIGTHFKAVYGIHGGNHNYFNTEWQHNDAQYGCVNQTPLFTGASNEVGSQAQRDAALEAVRNFFGATVGKNRNPKAARIFDPVYAAPSGPRIDRAFSASPTYANSLRLEEFTGPVGTNSNWTANNSNGLASYSHNTGSVERDRDYPSAAVTWEGGASTNKYLQINWASLNSGWDLRSYPYLEFRVDQGDNRVTTTPEFSIQLVNANDTRSNSLSSAQYVTLSPLPGTKTGEGHPTWYHPILKTVRIPLSAFTGVDLSRVRGVRFTFNRTGSGNLMFAQINATVDTNLAKGRPVTVSSVQDNNGALAGAKAVDGDLNTRWSSAWSDPQWFYVDLGFPQRVSSVILYWEAAYAKDYMVQVSNDASTWSNVSGWKNISAAETRKMTFDTPRTARYVRVNMTARGTQYGYSLYEFEVYGH